MQKLRLYLGALAFILGLGAAFAVDPGESIPGNAYFEGECETVIRTDCLGGPLPCTFVPTNEQLYWDIEDEEGQPAGICTEPASFTP